MAVEGFRVSQGTQDLDFRDTVSRWVFSPLMFRGAPTVVRFWGQGVVCFELTGGRRSGAWTGGPRDCFLGGFSMASSQ